MTLSDVPQFQPVWEVVRDRIRSAILSGELPAGQRLVEMELGDQFGISRGPIRVALRELAREGLVVDLPRRGTVVCTITQADLMEVYAVREALEVQAVRDAVAVATRTEREEVSHAHEKLVKAWDNDNFKEAASADMHFHQAIILLARNQRLADIYEQMARQNLLLLITASESDVSLRTAPMQDIHQEMVDAVTARDAKRAVQAIRRHYEYTRGWLLGSLDEDGTEVRTSRGGRTSSSEPGNSMA
jgi:DNA-binding GntR family transcriptional regulator